MKTSTIISKAYYLLGIFIIFIFWILLSTIQNDEFIYPSITTIFTSLIDILSQGIIIQEMLTSLLRVIVVIFTSIIISTIISFLYLIKKESYEIFKPILVLLKATPLAIISVYLWISIGGEKAPNIISLIMVLPICIQGFISSIDQIDIRYINQLKTEDVSKFKKYTKIYIPLIFPYIVMTLLQTFGMAIKVMLMGEYICQTNTSLGRRIFLFKQNLEFNNLLSLLILIVIVVMIIELIINKISKKIINH